MSGGVEHPPSLFAPLYEKVQHAFDALNFMHIFDAHDMATFFDAVVCSLIAVAGLSLLAAVGKKNLSKVPGKVQNILEVAVEGIRGILVDLIGPDGPKYLPLMGTLFLYIFANNLIGLIPGLKSPTMSLSTTFALGFTVFVCVHTIAIKANGLAGYLKHFAGDVAWLAPLFFVIHVVGEFAKPASLSLRLYGNIFGEDNVIAALLGMGKGAYIPLQAPMLAFGIFTAFLQSFIFTSLSCIYIQGFTEHAGHHGHEGHDGHEHHGKEAHAHSH
jgi:F-type H+-transporting ATPase subunit a